MSRRADGPGMTRLGDLLKPNRAPTPEEARAIRPVHDLAVEFSRLAPISRAAFLHEVRTLTTGYQRFVATRFTPMDSPLFVPLMALLDALIAGQDVIPTPGGLFEREDLHEASAVQTTENGRRVIKFPVRHPWKRKPNPDTGQEGERGQPIYRHPDQRGPEIGSFRAIRTGEAVKPEFGWVDEGRDR